MGKRNRNIRNWISKKSQSCLRFELRSSSIEGKSIFNAEPKEDVLFGGMAPAGSGFRSRRFQISFQRVAIRNFMRKIDQAVKPLTIVIGDVCFHSLKVLCKPSLLFEVPKARPKFSQQHGNAQTNREVCDSTTYKCQRQKPLFGKGFNCGVAWILGLINHGHNVARRIHGWRC